MTVKLWVIILEFNNVESPSPQWQLIDARKLEFGFPGWQFKVTNCLILNFLILFSVVTVMLLFNSYKFMVKVIVLLGPEVVDSNTESVFERLYAYNKSESASASCAIEILKVLIAGCKTRTSIVR
jgi:hypothetical protein